jgi:hypothetical protein
MAHRYRNDLQAGLPGFDSQQGRRFFATPQSPDQLWGPLSFLCNGSRGSFAGYKVAGVRSLTTRVHIEYWSYTAAPQCVLMPLCLIN